MLASSFDQYMWASFLAKVFHTSVQTVWAIQTIAGIVIAILVMIIYFLISIKRR